MPLAYGRQEGELIIDDITMNPDSGAWGIISDENGKGGLIPLWADFDVRGQDRLLPGVVGVIPYPRRITVTRHDFRLIIVGDFIEETGLAATNPVEGLAANLEYLRANVFDPPGGTDGTRLGQILVPGQANRTADIHVLGFVTQSYLLLECGAALVGTLQISIPGGRFS